MKKIFLDCGANDGCSVDLFRKHYPNSDQYEIHSFEPNPVFKEKLELKNVNFYPLAVSIKDGSHDFYFDPIQLRKEDYFTNVLDKDKHEYASFGSTLIKEKMEQKKSKYDNIDFPTVSVQGIDFSKWILDTFSKEDYIVLKMDIEGAEYDVLKKMIIDGSLDYIDVMYIEFHGDKMNNSVDDEYYLQEMEKRNIKIFNGPGEWNTIHDKLTIVLPTDKNLVFWTGLKSKDKFLVDRHNDYSWMEYSKKTWEYWCKQHGFDFYAFEEPIENDLVTHRPNWQRWKKILEFIDDYDQVLSTDASIMIKWNAPNLFALTDNKFTALKSKENMKWTWESANGYKPLFNNFNFDVKKYFNSGFVFLNKEHKSLLNEMMDWYYKNHSEVVRYQTEVVKRGTDQPCFNYFTQMNNIDINFLPIKYGMNHLFRWQVLGNNWQLKEDNTPFFIKYIDVWIFSGFSDRGITRNKLMKQTWDLTKHHYHERDGIDEILEQVKHKNTAKYTVSRQFKRDLLEFFGQDYNDKICLELGTSQGQTTRVLSYAFKQVISVEIDDWNIEQANITCNGRDNVEIRKFDLYQDEWNFPKDVAVVFIDANHTYDGVMSDIINSIKYFDDPILILDDYGHPKCGVKQAVDELVKSGKIEIIKQMGEDKLTHLSGEVNIDVEGIICRGIK